MHAFREGVTLEEYIRRYYLLRNSLGTKCLSSSPPKVNNE